MGYDFGGGHCLELVLEERQAKSCSPTKTSPRRAPVPWLPHLTRAPARWPVRAQLAGFRQRSRAPPVGLDPPALLGVHRREVWVSDDHLVACALEAASHPLNLCGESLIRLRRTPWGAASTAPVLHAQGCGQRSVRRSGGSAHQSADGESDCSGPCASDGRWVCRPQHSSGPFRWPRSRLGYRRRTRLEPARSHRSPAYPLG